MTNPTKDKLEKFCQLIIAGERHIDAYYKAGYSPNVSRLSAHSAAKRMLKYPCIITRLNELRDMTTDNMVMTVLARKHRLSELGRAELFDFVDEDGMPKKPSKEIAHHAAVSDYTVTETYTKKGDRIVTRIIKLHNPIPAIAELNKMEKIYSDTAGNTTNNTQINIIVDSPQAQNMLQRVLSGERTERELPSGS